MFSSLSFMKKQHQGITNYTGPEICFFNRGHLGLGGNIWTFEAKKAKMYTCVFYNTSCGVIEKCKITDGRISCLTIVE